MQTAEKFILANLIKTHDVWVDISSVQSNFNLIGLTKSYTSEDVQIFRSGRTNMAKLIAIHDVPRFMNGSDFPYSNMTDEMMSETVQIGVIRSIPHDQVFSVYQHILITQDLKIEIKPKV